MTDGHGEPKDSNILNTHMRSTPFILHSSAPSMLPLLEPCLPLTRHENIICFGTGRLKHEEN
jgi:hypothetical protein